MTGLGREYDFGFQKNLCSYQLVRPGFRLKGFSKGLRFAKDNKAAEKWNYMNQNQKWAFIKKEAWSRTPVECEVLI